MSFQVKPSKTSINFCIDTLKSILKESDTNASIKLKIDELELLAEKSSPDMIESTIDSHVTMCEVKQMGDKEAFGHDPAVFYSMALAGECGELTNCLTRVLRVGGGKEEKQKAIRSELCDVLIYAIILAYTNDIDPNELVEEKTKVVIDRAKNGYYGGPLVRK